jgi:hypothetical protein
VAGFEIAQFMVDTLLQPSNLRSLDLKYGMLLIEIGKAKLDNEP